MKQFLINLFKIEQYFYVHCFGNDKRFPEKKFYYDLAIKVSGDINISYLKEYIGKRNNFDEVYIVNIIAISKKQYNELNKQNINL